MKAHEPAGAESDDKTDPVVEAFKKDVDKTLIIENLRLTPAERGEKFLRSMRLIYELRRAGKEMRASKTRA